MSLFTRPRPESPQPAAGASTADDAVEEPRAGRRHPVAAAVLTVLALLLLLVALVAPDTAGSMTPAAFLRIPVEGLVVAALLLVLPTRARWVVAIVLGAVLGLLTVLKLLDIGYSASLARPFDPVLDWALLDDAVSLLTDSVGGFVGGVAVVVAILLAVGLPVLLALAMLRLGKLVARRNTAAVRTIAVLAVVWTGLSVLGTQIVPGVPVASVSAAELVGDRVQRIGNSVADQQAFAEEVARDAFRDTPADQLLTALRGKDVLIVFVESYGRTAVESPKYAQVTDMLEQGNQRLAAAGLGARSAFMTSSTSGGYSWLAHATTMSGLWINTQQRYTKLVESDRLTLNGAFHRAGWRTVGVMPAITQDWPEGEFYGYDQLYDSRNVGYVGPRFSYATMPDQFTLAHLQRTERAATDRQPLMAEIALVSSHSPWTAIPELIDWNAVGDGWVYSMTEASLTKGAMAGQAPSPADVWRDPARLRASYGQSVVYSLDTLVSYMENYGDENTVMVVLGDHQPAPFITGEGASKDVPISIVAKDPAVLAQVDSWGWQDGLRPGPQSPVWRMDEFRDRFLTTFGSHGAGT